MPSAFILRFARKRLQDLADWARACAETLDAAFQETGEILVQTQLDHGGGVDDAVARWGGTRDEWIDLSTGINPIPYPVSAFNSRDWTSLPDRAANDALLNAAHAFWNVPNGADIIAAPGASALIAQMPRLFSGSQVHIPAPTYNEHAAAFRAANWSVRSTMSKGEAPTVLVQPNNPNGKLWTKKDADRAQVIIDESFADICPDRSLIARAAEPGCVVLKSFGKFWGLAGLRLGFAIGHPETLKPLRSMLGPWAVSGPALTIGTNALNDTQWAHQTRTRLAEDAARLDALMTRHGYQVVGGTTLFRLYDCEDAGTVQDKLARSKIWSRIFPYSQRWLRLGIPGPSDWPRLEAALAS